jgi:methyltransferase domain protein
MLTEFLIKQSQKPSGLIGRVITKIWSFYFKKLSLWAIKQTTISDNYRILEIGYGGGSTIKNLLALNKNLEIHGIDISKESYRTA